MLFVESGPPVGVVVPARRGLAHRDLGNHRTSGERRRQLLPTGRHEATHVGHADRPLARTRACQRGPLDQLQLVEPAVPHRSQIVHRHTGTRADHARLGHGRPVKISGGAAYRPHSGRAVGHPGERVPGTGSETDHGGIAGIGAFDAGVVIYGHHPLDGSLPLEADQPAAGRLVVDSVRSRTDRHHPSQVHSRSRQTLGGSPGEDAGQLVPGADRLHLHRSGRHHDLLAEDPQHAIGGSGHDLGTGVDTDRFPSYPRVEGDHAPASLLCLGSRLPPRTALADDHGVAMDHLEADRAIPGRRSGRRWKGRVSVGWVRLDPQTFRRRCPAGADIRHSPKGDQAVGAIPLRAEASAPRPKTGPENSGQNGVSLLEGDRRPVEVDHRAGYVIAAREGSRIATRRRDPSPAPAAPA